jgi:hypothetical protein
VNIVFENRVLRRIFGPRRDEMRGYRRKLHNEELHNLYSSPNIIRMITSRRVRWAGHVAPIENNKVHAEIPLGNTSLRRNICRQKGKAKGRAIAQAVRRWFPTAASRVQTLV